MATLRRWRANSVRPPPPVSDLDGRADPSGPEWSLDGDVSQLGVAAKDLVVAVVLHARAVGEHELLVVETDEADLLGDHLVNVTPRLLAGGGVGDQEGLVDLGVHLAVR